MQGQKLRDLKSAAKNAVTAFLAGQDRTNPRTRVALIPYADAVNVGSLANVVHVERDANSRSEPPSINAARQVATAPDNCATDREGTLQFTDVGPETAMVNRDWRLQFCPASRLMPLSTNETALNDAIDDFRAAGNTAGQIGIQ